MDKQRVYGICRLQREAGASLKILRAFRVAFVGIVSNGHALCLSTAWLAWICKLPPVVVGIIFGITPPVLPAVLILMLLPLCGNSQVIVSRAMTCLPGVCSGIIKALDTIIKNPSLVALFSNKISVVHTYQRLVVLQEMAKRLDDSINRRNLHVLLYAQVAKVLPTESSHGKPDYKEVELAEDVDGTNVADFALAQEIILSAGSIGRPHILMNSGTGNSAELSRIGIKTFVNVPSDSAGKNLSDHPNATAAQDRQEWTTSKIGPSWMGRSTTPDGFVSRRVQAFLNTSLIPLRDNTANVKFEISKGLSHVPLPTNIGNMFIFVVSTAPTSRGSITLN
ncbi:hypothetical protein FPV67DRAFT_1667580 [Lyophyllum atratum]|nr:hypothetical protein FPV67DRAFT_1667580 [Lyophyllum atratum]